MGQRSTGAESGPSSGIVHTVVGHKKNAPSYETEDRSRSKVTTEILRSGVMSVMMSGV